MGAKRDLKTLIFRFVIVTIYCVLGAGIFYCIEYTDEYNDEITRKEKLYNKTKRNIIGRLGINESEFELLVAQIIDAKSDSPLEWSFSTGVDLCMQTMTTIGYGNKTPTTLAGQLFLIPFALIGIPLTAFFLNTIGENLSHLIHCITNTFEKKILRRKEVKNSELKCLIAINILSIGLTFCMAAASTKSWIDNWTFGQGLYVWFVTFSTIGFGDHIPGTNTDRNGSISAVMHRLFAIIIGLSLLSTIFNIVGDFTAKQNPSQRPKLCDGCVSMKCSSKKASEEQVHEFELENNNGKKRSFNMSNGTENEKKEEKESIVV